MAPDYSLLKDPFYNALQTAQKHFAIGNGQVQKFAADVLPFAGMHDYSGETLRGIEPYLAENETIFFRDSVIDIPANWLVLNRLPVIQMVCSRPVDVAITEQMELLGENDYAALFELVNLVQPGYFKEHTHRLGKYYGIRKNDRLVAVAGERLKITGFTEVSAVCTLPQFTGRGYAQQLMALLINEIFSAGNVPFLHVLETNTRAIKLYQYLNFTKSMDFPLVKAMIAR